mgnify:CR=1 FL=1
MSSELYLPEDIYEEELDVSGDEMGEYGIGEEDWDEDGELIDVEGEMGWNPFSRRNLRKLALRSRRGRRPRRIYRRPPALASSPIPTPVNRIMRTAPRPDGYSILPLDTGATAIAAGAAATISAQCQQMFKPMSIVFDTTVAPDFVVTGISCGNVEQFVGTGQVPASNFSTENAMNQLNLDSIPPALSLVIDVTNVSGAPRRLRGWACGFKAR